MVVAESMRRALITGITGQDGSYLTELLLDKGYEVHGLIRPATDLSQSRIAGLCAEASVYSRRLFLHPADLATRAGLRDLVGGVRPTELYHLASQSHVGLSHRDPEGTCEVVAMGTLRVLEAARALGGTVRVFNAASSEVFGGATQSPQDEDTPLAPVNPYGCAKAFALQAARTYRRSYGLHVCNGILYNHESPRRGGDFVVQKICRAAAAIRLGIEQELVLGDTGVERDWGHARDYVEVMWLTLQPEVADDYVIATGRVRPLQEVVELAFATVGLDWRDRVRHDPDFKRPVEPGRLCGDARRARERLGWAPRTGFEEMIREMVNAHLGRLAPPCAPA